MHLDVLPTRRGGAAENMAIDFLLLQRYPEPPRARFRHYEWRTPAFTFGYSQPIATVREQITNLIGPAASAGTPPAASLDGFDLCRRRTGGGVVDHREDWTYALVIPRGHRLEEMPASESYRIVHEAMAEALRGQGVDCRTKARSDQSDASDRSDRPAAPGVCFQRAEIFDVVRDGTGEKIAGAAQKRNRHGLLLQGSIWRPAAGGDAIDWDRFQADFIARLATALEATAAESPWPEFNDDELAALIEEYASPEWNGFR